ncbi:MAG TPA: tRNA adenosine(34) deaminase TadA [Nitrospirota bacterium]|nr:tRNA adenosine(34) deaminase TadA [Nitrospirota bacterium]
MNRIILRTPEREPVQRTDEDFMALALAEAHRAETLGETPVGAVLVIGNEAISSAHNMRETWQDPAAHAELLAVREASARLGRWRLSDATLYVTLEPCLMCAGVLVLARVGRLVYGCRDPKAGVLGSVYDVVRDGRLNHTYRITPGILEAECRQVLQRFFEKARNKPHGSKAARV